MALVDMHRELNDELLSYLFFPPSPTAGGRIMLVVARG